NPPEYPIGWWTMIRTLSARLFTLAALAALALPVSRARANEALSSAIYQQALKATVFIMAEEENGVGVGTGWVANVEKGLIVTNDHVAGHAKRLRVFFPNLSGGEQANTREELIRSGKGVPAKLLLTDPKTDLAVIQVESLPEGTTALKLADRSI